MCTSVNLKSLIVQPIISRQRWIPWISGLKKVEKEKFPNSSLEENITSLTCSLFIFNDIHSSIPMTSARKTVVGRPVGRLISKFLPLIHSLAPV